MKAVNNEVASLESPAKMLDLIRGLDLIFWNLLAFYLIICSTVQTINITAFPFLTALPLFCIAWVTFKMGSYLSEPKQLSASVNKMSIYALAAAFNYPFYIFLLSYYSPYYLACTFVALTAFYLFLSELVSISSKIAGDAGDVQLQKECSKTIFLLYLSAFLLAAYFSILYLPDLAYKFFSIPSFQLIAIFVFIIIMFPLLLPLTLLFRLRQVTVKNFKEKHETS